MNIKKIKFNIISTVVMSIFSCIWNGFIHVIVLGVDNQSITAIHRPDLANKIWISLVVTVFIALLFSMNYYKWAKNNSIIESITHSLFFAFLMIIVVDLNQYVQYAIPFSLIVKWSFFGLLEFQIYGQLSRIIYTLFCKDRRA